METGHNVVAMIIDPLTKREQWIPIKEANLAAENLVKVFIDGYIRSWGLSVLIVSD